MKKNIAIQLWALSVCSALLLSIPFILPHTGMVALVALVPLFAAEYIATKNSSRHFFVLYFCTFLIWNIITTYWIYLATLPGAIAAIVLNSLQMAVIFRIFRWSRRRLKGLLPYLFLMFMWTGWEHFYHTWQVSWPWLTLGNSFAASIKCIQWYEVTGTLGGSIWIWLVNILLFSALAKFAENGKYKRSLAAALLVFLIPTVVSHIRYYTYKENKGSEKEVAILQPNIDPYNDKFGGLDQLQQDSILLHLAQQAVTPNTFLILAPETFYSPNVKTGHLNEDTPYLNLSFNKFRDFAQRHHVNFIYGAVTQIIYRPQVERRAIMGTNFRDPGVPPTPTARMSGPQLWYDVFNTAVFNSYNGSYKFYHKSKLVILAESTPIVNGKNIFKSLGIDLGGGIGNYGTQAYREIFKTPESLMLGTAICYESVYGDFYREYINRGAQAMTIITNDGWWGNTFGHRQHLHYASLRAIETRRAIARCANTGISAFISQRGDITSQTPWWNRCYLRGTITFNNALTPFVKYGDVAGVLSFWLAVVLLCASIASKIKSYFS